MKCSAIQLYERTRHQKQPLQHCDIHPSLFTAEETHSYSFPWIRRNMEPNSRLKITNIALPESAASFNTGASLEKWSKKRPRLKSSLHKTDQVDRNFCYDTLETDLSLLLAASPDNLSNDNDSLSNIQYEVHTDIEELLLKSQRSEEEGHKQKKTKKKHKAITLSRPPTPQTEQVIRVDLVANKSAKDEQKSAVNGEEEVEDEEDFVVKCRRLALKNTRRRRRPVCV